MSSVISSAGSVVPATLVLQPRRWTCAEFHSMGDMGWFEGRRAMLIDGEILEMPGPNPRHATITTKIDYTLRNYFGSGFILRNQSPLVLSRATDPEPDIAIVRGELMDFLNDHPTTAALVIEVAESTLAFDTTHKANLYASANIEDYWVVDLVGNRLLVFRCPRRDASQPFGASYAAPLVLQPPAALAPLCQPLVSIPVADLLP